jgi:NADH:ubiquinone oxidoreductase subunit F (NADH-binding)
MSRIPHYLIEGMITSSFALGANTSYIYVRGEYYYVIAILEKAIKEAYEAGMLGNNIQGSSYSLDMALHTSAGRYICGEETALINALEGKRANPRFKPPFPQVSGLWGRPTLVLSHSDDTVVTNFVALSTRTAESITNAKSVHYGVDLRGKRRYLRLAVTTATTTNDGVTVCCGATLSQLENAPNGTTGVADSVVFV